jgi:hypothetical protein
MRTPRDHVTNPPQPSSTKMFDSFALRSRIDRRTRNLAHALQRAESSGDHNNVSQIRSLMASTEDAA